MDKSEISYELLVKFVQKFPELKLEKTVILLKKLFSIRFHTT